MHTLSSTDGPISPMRVSPNGRGFVDKSGNPVFWLGDTQWELFRLFTADRAMRILRDRREKGFNVILIMLTGVDTARFDPTVTAPYVNLKGDAPWLDDDPLTPNETYFRHIDTLIRLGEQTGQVFVVGVYHQWHVNVIRVEKARAWARWVARRYRDVPNLMWSMYPKATDAYIPVCRELAAGLQEGDGGAHLITVHPDPSVASSSFIHDEAWLAFNMIQTCIDYDRIVDAVAADYACTPVKPVIMAEGGYEGVEFGKLQTAQTIRKQAYWTQLAGGYHVYGHNDAWKSPLAWEQWLDAPGSRHLRLFREIMLSCDGWWDLVPDPSLLTRGVRSGEALNTAARSAAGDWLLVYLSEPGEVSVRLDALVGGDRAQATWIDPSSGERRPAGAFRAGGVQDFCSPRGWEDALLRVDAGKAGHEI